MSNTKATHTPGPWRYLLGRGANPRFHVQGPGGYQVASTTELNKHPMAQEENEMREFNARLIASAPDLLAALKALLETVLPDNVCNVRIHEEPCSCYSCRLFDMVENARAAIARAEGGAE